MAEGKDFTETLENLVTCVICCDILENPKTLPCLHTLCLKCIEGWNKTCNDKRLRFSCPSCKALVNVPDGDVVKLPTSFHHNSLIEFYNTFKNQAGDPQQLQECSGCSNRRVAVGFCFQCQGKVCNECYNSHKTLNVYKDNHQALLWNEFNKASINSYMENKAFCQEKFHEKCLLEYYCQACKKSICQKCILTSHITHDKISIEEAVHIASDRIKTEHARIDEVVEIRKKELQLTRKTKYRIQDQIREEVSKMHRDLEAKVKMLQAKHNALFVEFNDKLEKKIEENVEQENTIRSALQEAVKLQDQCKTMTNMNLKHFILEGYEKLEEVCKSTVKDEPILSTSPVETFVHYIPDPKATEMLKDFEFGKIEESVTDPSRCTIECIQPTRCGFMNQFSIVTKDSRGDICYTNKTLIEVNIQDNDGNDVRREVTESQPGQFAVKFRVENVSPYNITVSIAGKTIQNSPQTINGIDASAEFKPVRFFQTIGARHPIALCISAKGHIAIVNNNKKNKCCIVLYDTGGVFVRAFGDEGIGEDRLSLPRGLAFTDNDHILVSDNTDDGACIKEYHINGKLIRTFHQQKGMFFSRMCIRVNNIVCVSYDRRSRNTSVKLFSRGTGDYLQDIKLHDSCPIAGPLFIAYVDKKYFVSFRDVDKVYVFRESGDYLYSFGERGDKEGQFGRLRGLAVFGADMLLVCDEVNDRVQLFRQDGQFIRTFGSSGSGLGQMHWPCDVAVARDDQIYVLEYRNQRIQVFR